MITAIGIDVVEVARIKKAMQKPGFVERILTEEEQKTCTTPERIAGRWAAKEAVAKAVGMGLGWHDVEVLNHESGAPYVRFGPKNPLRQGQKIHVSITHESAYAAAVAIVELVGAPV